MGQPGLLGFVRRVLFRVDESVLVGVFLREVNRVFDRKPYVVPV